MRWARVLMLVLLAGTLAWSESSAAGLDAVAADGWHSWQVDDDSGHETRFFVRVENGKPVRIHSLNWNCRKPTTEPAIDHGRVSAAQSYAWFRAVVEDFTVDERVRDAALFGLVESDSDEAIDYIDQILSRR